MTERKQQDAKSTIENEVSALYALAEGLLMQWLDIESPIDRRRQKALELLADAGRLLHSACVNLDVFKTEDVR